MNHGNRPGLSSLDDAIDRAVAGLTSGDAPADLRARVLARIAAAPAPRERRAPWGRPFVVAGWTAAAAALVLAAALWRRPAPPTMPPAPVLPDARAIVGAAAAPVAPVSHHELAPRRPPVERLAEFARGTNVEPAATGRFQPLALVEPLATPPPIEIAPLSASRLAVEPMVTEPLTFMPVTIAPLSSGR